MNVTTLLATTGLVATDAETVLEAVEYLVQQAETASPTATGAQKLAAVKAGLLSYVTTSYPAVVSTFDALWSKVVGIINALVAIYNSLGLFTKTVPAN